MKNMNITICRGYSYNIDKKNLYKDEEKNLILGDKIQAGKWTMVYDEGFDILVNNYSFFAFSKYAPNKTQMDPIFVSEQNTLS